jgi:hypothetical protein
MKRPTLRRLCLTASCLLGALALTACAVAPKPVIPQPFREPCVGPDTPVKSIGDMGVFSVMQEVVIQDCESKRAGLVKLLEPPTKKPWYKFW